MLPRNMLETLSGDFDLFEKDENLTGDWAKVSGAKLEILVREKGPTINQVHTVLKKDLV